MATPEWIKKASLEKRKRTCTICGTQFVVRNACVKGVACSPACLAAFRSNIAKGRKQSVETIAKRSASLKEVRRDPERNARWNKAVAKGIAAWHADPGNAKAFSKRSSERMKRLHADPEWQKSRDERSSRVMKETWRKYRDRFTALSRERYERGETLNTGGAAKNRDAACSWIMKQAQAALRANTEFNEVFTETQERLRIECPFDGDGDYQDYLAELGRKVTTDEEVRRVADRFMSEAIPQFAAKWNARKKSNKG